MMAMLSTAHSSFAQSGDAAESAVRLPVSRVILYKNGVGYFEHAGLVHDNQDVNVEFTTAQLNDVLKSLTVLDMGNGRITGVSYNSNAPLEKRLSSLHLPVGENPTTAQFLDALRGARLEIRSESQTAAGRLLSIDEREIPIKGDQKITVDQISLVTDSGEVRVFDLTPTTSVRVAEKDVDEEIGKYLSLIASTRDQDVRRMTISTAGNGERNLLVSYISEVPVWKSTYRIVVPTDGKPLLQGWAIVDNTVGEDWKDVELSLVAGAPQSFVQELSQPYYTRRPVVALPENALLTPQTHEATMEEAKMPAPAPPAVSLNTLSAVGGVPGAFHGNAIGGPIAGISSGSGGGIGGGRFAGSGVERLGLGKSAFEANQAVASLEATTTVAQTRDLGDLFEYKLKDHVTIRKNQSALVPILQTRIDAENVTVWNPSESAALRALWLNNTSPLTFDGGTFNVLEGDAFAGEGLMDPIKPGEKRLLSYAADLGVLVDSKRQADPERVCKVSISHGVMTETTEQREEHTYTVRNRDTASRTVVIEHPARAGWKLTEGEDPVESSVSYHRFRLTVEPKKTATLTVKEYHPMTSRLEISNFTDSQIRFFMAAKMIDAETDHALHKVAAQKDGIAALDADLASHKSQLTSISEDQQRVRENMKALKGSAEEKALVERYVRQLNQQEDRVQALQREISELQEKRSAGQKALNETIEGIQMEVTL
jgi:hypothetical protein